MWRQAIPVWASDAGVRRATRARPLRRGRPGVAAGLRHGEGAGAGRGRSKEKAPLSQRSRPFLKTKQIVYKPEIIQSIKQATMEMKHHRVRFLYASVFVDGVEAGTFLDALPGVDYAVVIGVDAGDVAVSHDVGGGEIGRASCRERV